MSISLWMEGQELNGLQQHCHCLQREPLLSFLFEVLEAPKGRSLYTVHVMEPKTPLRFFLCCSMNMTWTMKLNAVESYIHLNPFTVKDETVPLNVWQTVMLILLRYHCGLT
jgi:hypothetical protein